MTERKHSDEHIEDNTKKVKVDGEEKLLMFDDHDETGEGDIPLSEEELLKVIEHCIKTELGEIFK